MIARASGLGMRVGRVSRLLRGVGVLAMPGAGRYTKQRVESVCVIQLGADVLQLRVPGGAVGVIIDRPCAADRVEVTR
jgi:hypothetical protein